MAQDTLSQSVMQFRRGSLQALDGESFSDKLIHPEQTITQDDRMQPDPAKVHWLWRETTTRLSVLARRVSEGKDILAASEFARWLRMSGLLHIFEIFKAGPPREVSASTISKQIDDLLWSCAEAWKRNPSGNVVQRSELEAINHKLDLIAGQVAQLGPQRAPADEQPQPLRVIDGGVAT